MSPAPGLDWLLIDGYSLLHRHSDLKPLLHQRLGMARQLLIREVEQTAGTFAPKTTIVFDGKQGTGDAEPMHTAIEILFAPGHLTADTVIERLVYAHPDPTRILVVTSDRAERETVMAAGADTLSCGDFLDRIRAAQRAHTSTPRTRTKRGATLGDFFP